MKTRSVLTISVSIVIAMVLFVTIYFVGVERNKTNEEAKFMTKEEIIAKFEDNYDMFARFVEYLKNNQLGLQCHYNKIYDTFTASVNRAALEIDLPPDDIRELIEVKIDDEALADIREFIEYFFFTLDFSGIVDYNGSVQFLHNDWVRRRELGIGYYEIKQEEFSSYYSSIEHIKGNWYYGELRYPDEPGKTKGN